MPTVLVVDDANVERTLVGGLIRAELGWTVIEAGSGEEALEQIERDRPDLVLTDLLMPGIDGAELAHRIHDTWTAIPVVVMTGKGAGELAARALREGAAGYLPKTRLAEDLADTLQRALSSAANGTSS